MSWKESRLGITGCKALMTAKVAVLFFVDTTGSTRILAKDYREVEVVDNVAATIC